MYYLIGKKLGHSHSVPIHAAFGKYDYSLMPLAEEELDAFVLSGDWEGFNITIPYKRLIMKYCDVISPEAMRIGSVNTVVRKNGVIYGYNTDYDGFLAAADRAGIDFEGKKVLILGSGGTSLTASCAASDRGAREVVIVSRSGENNYGNIAKHYDSEIIVNATPVGMYPECGKSLVSPDDFTNLCGVIDVIYNPLATPLLLRAAELGIRTASGLYMLVAQAARACGYFCGEVPGKEKTDAIYSSLCEKVSDIILVGMPGCGKSSVGEAIAGMCGKVFVDTDAIIVKESGMSIPEIFSAYGEEKFRELEKKAIAEACAEGGRVIATGGGAVLSDDNLYPMKQNGRIYFLSRDINKLARGGRPLSENSDINVMYRVRLPRYLKFADRIIENNKSIDECAASVTDDFIASCGARSYEKEVEI